MPGTLEVDQADHCVIVSPDCSHYVGHGITGTQGMAVTVALRPEKIRLNREAPPLAPDGQPHNAVRGTVKELSYFGSHTVYQLELASGARLKVSQANVDRYRDDALTWGDSAWASWSESAHVVLTQ
jgi:putrescine transport system ATP-binding protein